MIRRDILWEKQGGKTVYGRNTAPDVWHREEFRKWLSGNCLSASGVWLLFGKTGGSKTIKAGEALEEALCFGWIDGQM